jgi:hypothetical protein
MGREALLVANSVSYSDPRRSVTPAILRRTIGRFTSILEGLPNGFEFRVVSLLDQSPSEVRNKLEVTARNAKETDDLVLFYYFGHGELSSDLELQFLHPPKAKKSPNEVLKLSTLENIIKDVGASKSIFILDCCYGGALKKTFPHSLSGEHCRLASTTPSSRAYVESGALEDPIGVFTGSIIDGLASSKACRSATDDSITADSLFRYAKHETKRRTNNVQDPTKQGDLSDPLSIYHPKPAINPGFSKWANEKTAYFKLLAICKTLAKRGYSNATDLYKAVISENPSSFETLYKTPNGIFKYKPVKPIVVSRYIRFLRVLKLVDSDVLKLLPEGRTMISSSDTVYNKNLLLAIDNYLMSHGLDRAVIENSLRQILSNRLVPTKRDIFDYLSLSGHRVPTDDLKLILDLLGYIGAIRMTIDRAYFPWVGEETRDPMIGQ